MDELTPEEKAELAQLESEELSPEEQAELAALEAGEKPAAPAPQSEGVDVAGNALAAYVGGMPFLPQLQGAGAAITDVVMGKIGSISELSDSYTQNRDSARQAQQELAKKYPVAYDSAEFAKNLGATAALPQAATATMTARALSAAALGVSESMLDDQETKDAFSQGLITGGISLGADVVSKGAIKGLGALAESSAMKSIGSMAKNSVKKIRELSMKGVTNAQQFFDDVINSKTLDNKPLVSVTKPLEEIAQDASELATYHGKQMGSSLAMIDQTMQGQPFVDGNILAARAAAKLQGARDLTSLNPDDVAEITKLQTFIDTAFSGKSFSLTDLHDIKTSLKGSYDLKKQSFELSKSDRIYKGIVDDLTDVIDNQVKVRATPESALSYFDAKRKFATMSVVADSARDAALKGSAGVLGDIRENLVRNIAIAGLSGAASSQNGNSFATGAAIGALLFNASRNPGVNTAIAKSLGRVGNALAKNPQRYNLLAQKIATAAALGDQELVSEVSAAEAELDLDAKPITRTSQDLIANKDKLYVLLESKGIATASLREAIDKSDGQAIANFMSGVSKLASMKSYIEPGIGWDGKVTDPTDIAIIQAGIQSNKGLTPRQRRLMEDELLSSGKIPAKPKDKSLQEVKVSRRASKIGGGSMGDF